MADKHDEQPRYMKTLSQEVHAFVKRRDVKHGEKVVEAKNTFEIQLRLSELENLLMKMSQSDPNVLATRQKLFELKIAFYRTLDIK
jgi:hypothetical protein